MFYTGAECFTAVTRLGYVDVIDDETEEEVPAERFLLLDNLNYLWTIDLFESADGYMSCYFNFSDKPVAGLTEEYPLIGTDDIGASMITGEDGKVYLSACDGETNNLYVIDVEFTDEYNELDGAYEGISGTAKKIGDAGDGVWPMLLTDVRSSLVTETDEETGITVTYTYIMDGIYLSVKTLESSETTVSYDIELVDEEGNVVDPDGKVVVEIPVPEGLKGEDAAVYVLNEDGTYTKVDAELVDGVFVFTTTELGVYAVSTEELDKVETPDETTSTPDDTTSSDATTDPDTTTEDPDPNMPTGIAIAIVPAVVSAAVVMVTKRRNRK